MSVSLGVLVLVLECRVDHVAVSSSLEHERVDVMVEVLMSSDVCCGNIDVPALMSCSLTVECIMSSSGADCGPDGVVLGVGCACGGESGCS